MDYKTFETEFLLLLKKRDLKCISLIDENKRVIESNLGYHSDPKTLDKFVDQLGNIVIDIKNKLLKMKNNFELIENVLNHPAFGKVREVFVNSNVLIKAVKNENKDAANWLITRMNINPKVQDENGMTALMIAAQKNFQFVVKPFLKNLECLDMEDSAGNNVLFYSVGCKQFIANEAISNNTYPIELINSGIDINHINHDGETALIYCIKKGYFKPIQHLIRNYNLDVNVVDNSGKTAAMYLVEKGNYFDFLSLHRKDCNYDYINIYNYQSVFSILLDKMYGMQLDSNTIKYYKPFIQIFTILVSYQGNFNIDVDADENTAFMVILGMKDLKSATLCAKHLRCLDLSVKNKYGENATSLCFKFGYEDILNIIKDNPTFNYYYRDSVNQNTLLIYSVINDSIFMNELLEYDPNIVNEVNSKSENALIVAIKMNKEKAVETLLSYGINVDQQDDQGNTALHYAIEMENPKLVQMIMKKNPKMDLKNDKNKTAMMLAEEIGNKNVLQVLSNPTVVVTTSNTGNQEVIIKYRAEMQTYIIPYINNNYPNYQCTKEMEKIKNEVYSRFVGTNFKKTMINNIVLV